MTVVWTTTHVVSIPQAVSTVATIIMRYVYIIGGCFNTASGKHCCNKAVELKGRVALRVSIPQAVSTVATKEKSLN